MINTFYAMNCKNLRDRSMVELIEFNDREEISETIVLYWNSVNLKNTLNFKRTQVWYKKQIYIRFTKLPFGNLWMDENYGKQFQRISLKNGLQLRR